MPSNLFGPSRAGSERNADEVRRDQERAQQEDRRAAAEAAGRGRRRV